jgi:predicted DNA-binding transcriptional regulator YafY
MRKWTLEDLMEACSDALYEYEGISDGVSKRTLQLDIQNMRSEKLGYNAPIVVLDKKFYTYDDKNYSITNSPLTNQDLGILTEVLGVLKQFKGFGYFQELSGMVTKLESKLYTQQNKSNSYIEFEKNDLLKGLDLIDPIHRAIINKCTLKVTYQSFKARAASEIIFYPYLLKEYRNRWFMLGKNNKNLLINFALDRIKRIEELPDESYKKADFDVFAYYSDSIGVSKTPNMIAQKIVLKIAKEHSPYIITKPLHSSQQIMKEEEDGTTFSIDVVWNFELEREILGFGEHIKVISPRRLKGIVKRRLERSFHQYETIENETEHN